MQELGQPDFLKIITQYQGLVMKIARFMAGKLPSSVQLDDLVQSGVMGLIEASKNFDGRLGVSFESFASFRIKGAMIDDLRKVDWTPRAVHREARHVEEVIDRLEQKNQGQISDQAVATDLQISLEDYQQLLASINCRRLVSSDELAELYGEDAAQTEISAELGPEGDAEVLDFHHYLSAVIEHLPYQEKMMLKFYYADDLNLKEIGDILEVSESRVSQIHRHALQALKTKLSSAGF